MLKHTMPNMVAYTCIPSTWETEAGGSGFQSQPELQVRYYLKKMYYVFILKQDMYINPTHHHH